MSAGRERAHATFWLLDAPDSLSAQSHREPDGTGLGWFAPQGGPRRSRQPIAAYGDAQFARRARVVESRTFVAHIRYASTGSLSVENTHPFEQRGRLFAHNGVVQDLPALEAELGAEMRLVHGETDSERLFALITREIDAAAGDVGEGIAAACRWVAAELPLLAINLVLATPDGLWALRYPATHELYVLEREPGAALDHRSSFRGRVSSAHGRTHRLVTVASERMDDDEGWRLLDPGEMVHVSGDLELRSSRILEGAPAHPLTLEELSQRARASQERVPR